MVFTHIPPSRVHTVTVNDTVNNPDSTEANLITLLRWTHHNHLLLASPTPSVSSLPAPALDSSPFQEQIVLHEVLSTASERPAQYWSFRDPLGTPPGGPSPLPATGDERSTPAPAEVLERFPQPTMQAIGLLRGEGHAVISSARWAVRMRGWCIVSHSADGTQYRDEVIVGIPSNRRISSCVSYSLWHRCRGRLPSVTRLAGHLCHHHGS